jgi:hypothetical protein
MGTSWASSSFTAHTRARRGLSERPVRGRSPDTVPLRGLTSVNHLSVRAARRYLLRDGLLLLVPLSAVSTAAPAPPMPGGRQREWRASQSAEEASGWQFRLRRDETLDIGLDDLLGSGSGRPFVRGGPSPTGIVVFASGLRVLAFTPSPHLAGAHRASSSSPHPPDDLPLQTPEDVLQTVRSGVQTSDARVGGRRYCTMARCPSEELKDCFGLFAAKIRVSDHIDLVAEPACSSPI